MKYFRLIGLIFIVHTAFTAELNLAGDWLFQLGDDSSWAQPEYNDSAWSAIAAPGDWETQLRRQYNGYAWYRYRFELDSTIFRRGKQDTLWILLGQINDVDATYLNGQRIGSRGTFPPRFKSARQQQRCYGFPATLLQRQNLLAVRVYEESERGGIYRGPLKIITQPTGKPVKAPLFASHRSYYQMPFTNGIGAANYNVETGEFDHFYPHIYRQYDDSTTTQLILESAKPIVYHEGNTIFLDTLQSLQLGYLTGTGIIKHLLQGRDFNLTLYAYAPFRISKAMWIFFLVLESDNIDQYALNFLFRKPDPYLNVGKWSYQQGHRKWLTVFLYYPGQGTITRQEFLRKYKNEHPGFSALTAEIEWWQQWQAQTRLPDQISGAQKRLYHQSLAFIKMAQCREEFPARGQIMASLPPGKDNWTYTLDQAYAVEALLDAGHAAEALMALQFLMNSRCGKYTHFEWQGHDYGIGRNYAVSVSSYLGNGTEDSHHNENGPNINLGGFGLTLWNLRHYIELSDDVVFLEYYWDKISQRIADVLVSRIDSTGLIAADSGPWQKHLPGKHYTYTSACAYRGLLDAAYLARLINRVDQAEKYENTADTIRKAIEEKLYLPEKNILKGNLEDNNPDNYLDASTIEVVNWIFTSQDEISSATLFLLNQYLTMDNGRVGYHRQAGGTWYDRQEDVFIDLRVANAYMKMTGFSKARKLISWVTQQAGHNFYILPEFFGEHHSDYEGAIPSCGRAAGAYISLFWRDYFH